MEYVVVSSKQFFCNTSTVVMTHIVAIFATLF